MRKANVFSHRWARTAQRAAVACVFLGAALAAATNASATVSGSSTTFQSLDQGTLSQGLVAFYQFNGNANDSTSLHNDGVAVNVTPTADRFGIANQAYHFNGSNSHVTFPDSVFGPQTQGFTFSAWVTPDSLSSAQELIVDKGSLNGEASMAYQNGHYTAEVKLASGWYSISSAATYQPNTLVHLVAVYQRGQQLQLWINGQMSASTAVPSEDLATGPNNSAIGSYSQFGTFPYGFVGTIDDVRIYNRGLSASEVTQLYSLESSSLSEGLVAFYQFNGNATDSSPMHNDGTAVNVTPTTDRFGNANQAYHFDGVSSHVTFPDSVFGPQTPGFTFSAWVTADSLSSDVQRLVIDKGSLNGEASIVYQGGQYAMQVKLTSGWRSIPTAATYPAGTLVQLVGVYQRGGQLQLWVNGQMSVSQAVPAEDLQTGPNSSAIGSYAQFGTFPFGFLGTIDDVRIYNRALSAAEITQLYAMESPGSASLVPVIQSEPQSTTFASGTSVTLSVSAVGAGKLTYQWFKDGRPIRGATNSTLTISTIQPSNVGQYVCAVTSPGGTTKTDPAVITVSDPGLLIYQIAGRDALFSGITQQAGGLSGYAVVDRPNKTVAFIWIRKDGSGNGAWTETRTDLTISQTAGGLPGEQTVIAGDLVNSGHDMVWLQGKDAVVQLDPKNSFIAPVLFFGEMNQLTVSSEVNVEMSVVELGVDRKQTLLSRKMSETLDTAVSRIVNSLPTHP